MAMMVLPAASRATSTPGFFIVHVEVMDSMLTSDGTWMTSQIATLVDIAMRAV